MRKARSLFIIILIGVFNHSWAQTNIQIGDLYYNLSGVSATVTNPLQNYKSPYTMDSYVIPSIVTYNELEFTVNEIGSYAFSGRSPRSDYWSVDNVEASTASSFILPNTIKKIGEFAFAKCLNLTMIIIPESVISFGRLPFYKCSFLRSIIYLPKTAPDNWVATSTTYVPDKLAYSSPPQSMNDAHVIEMITFDQTDFEYSGQPPSTTWTNNVEGYSASFSMSSLNGDVGNHEEWIPVTFTKGEESFTANVVYRYTINPAKLTAKVSNASREYGEDNPPFNVSYSGFVSGENENVLTTQPTIRTSATKTSNVGDYSIKISGGSAKNYELVYEPGVLTVTKAALSAKVNDATKVYGSQNPVFTIDYYGLKNGETAPAWTTSPTFSTDASPSSDIGQYTVMAINGVPINYDLGEITPGILSVTPAPLTIKADDAVRQYYNDEPTFSYRCIGFVNGDDESVLTNKPTLSTSATRTSNVGTYEIKVSDASSTNYSISNVNGTLTVTPRTLLASVENYERIYNEENPDFEIKFEGFVGSEDESVLITKPSANTAATATSDVGTYPIKVSGGNAVNYQFSYQNGILTINKAEQTISWEQDMSNLNVGDQIELQAKASSGLPISYTMDSNNSAEIYSAGTKTYLDCKAGGQFFIRAIQNGNKNYYSSPRISNTVTIIGTNPTDDPMLTIKQADNGIVSVPVTKGSVYTLTILPSNGWKVHSVTFNNSDVTSQMSSDGKFTTPIITDNSTLSVVYEEEGNAVSSVRASGVIVQSTSTGARVINANMGDDVRIYTNAGVLLHSIKADSQIIDVPLSKGDVYIVKVGEKAVKLSH